MDGPVPYERIAGHLTVVPVELNGSVRSSFILDTGIGFPLLSLELAAKLGVVPVGTTFTGKRMSGQEIRVPLGSLPSLRFGTRTRSDLTVGIIDLRSMLPAFPQIEGFLAPGFFSPSAFTIHPGSATIKVEDDRSLADRASSGRTVPLHVTTDGPSVSLFVDLRLPDGEVARVELDTGSDVLILNLGTFLRLGLRPESPGVRTVGGRDETGHEYVRYFARLPGVVAFDSARDLAVSGVDAMFQEIIYDGLLGTRILDRYDATLDLAGGRLILSARPM